MGVVEQHYIPLYALLGFHLPHHYTPIHTSSCQVLPTGRPHHNIQGLGKRKNYREKNYQWTQSIHILKHKMDVLEGKKKSLANHIQLPKLELPSTVKFPAKPFFKDSTLTLLQNTQLLSLNAVIQTMSNNPWQKTETHRQVWHSSNISCLDFWHQVNRIRNKSGKGKKSNAEGKFLAEEHLRVWKI